MRDLTVFLDDGGVMNDNAIRGGEWQRLLGEFFPPRLGGTSSQWSEANRTILKGLWDRHFMDQALRALVGEYHQWSRNYQLDWLRTMAETVGVPAPADDEVAFDLALEAAYYVTSNCKSFFLEVPEAVTMLSAEGYSLHTASGEDSHELDGYLRSMGVREHFGTLFGPDIVDAFKAGQAYYERAFAHTGLHPSRCVVVDDSTAALAWAAAAGAKTVLVDRAGRMTEVAYESHIVRDLSGLPALLETLGS